MFLRGFVVGETQTLFEGGRDEVLLGGKFLACVFRFMGLIGRANLGLPASNYVTCSCQSAIDLGLHIVNVI